LERTQKRPTATAGLAARSGDAVAQVDRADNCRPFADDVADPDEVAAERLGCDAAAELCAAPHQVAVGVSVDLLGEQLAELGLVDLAVVELVPLERVG
jgi:hypothetical protein